MSHSQADVDKRFTAASRQQLQQGIAAAGGQEIFCRGRLDDELRVDEVEILARGNEQAVTALVERCRYRDVIIHNHPSGLLRPSDADLEIASLLGNQGCAFYLVDNKAQDCYCVVEPWPEEPPYLSSTELASYFAPPPEGRLAAHLPRYESRPQQLEMAQQVLSTWQNQGTALLEAGTGTGKSLAYLIPSLLKTLQEGKRLVISTKTINLQEQLLHQDIPLAAKAIPQEFHAALVKGRQNYLCLRRLERTTQQPGLFADEEQNALHSLQQWAQQTQEGCRQTLSPAPPSDVWQEVCAESDQCLRVRCPHYRRCFLHKARRQAAAADVLIVNHALLLADLAVRQQAENQAAAAVLPPFRYLVLDEAHHLPEVATDAFALMFSTGRLRSISKRLQHPRHHQRGVLPRLSRSLSLVAAQAKAAENWEEITGRIQQQNNALLAAAHKWQEETISAFWSPAQQSDQLQRHRLQGEPATDPAISQLQQQLQELRELGQKLTTSISDLLALIPTGSHEQQQELREQRLDLEALQNRLAVLVKDLQLLLAQPANSCTWLEVQPGNGRRPPRCVMLQAPLDIASELQQCMWPRLQSAILTSATLTVDESFSYLRQRLGLADDQTECRLFPAPFDYAQQGLLLVDSAMPLPDNSHYLTALQQRLEEAITLAGGGTLVLCTSWNLLRQLHRACSPLLQAQGWPCLLQGQSNRSELLQRFRREEQSCLFATEAFWEGVDIPGRALQQVIIPRLPFRVPTEPLQQARSEALRQQGLDPFRHYQLPQAVLKLKQGIGRLIRHRQDKGIVLMLDARLAHRNYGAIVRRSLPPLSYHQDNWHHIYQIATRFWQAHPWQQG